MAGAARARRQPRIPARPAVPALCLAPARHEPLHAARAAALGMSAADAAQIAALAGIAFLGALVFGVTGFGSALVAIPLATHLVPLPFALALFALSDLACSWSVGLENPKGA